MLPSLHAICPNLQVLAVTSGYSDPNATPNSDLLRLIPLTTTAGLESVVAEEFAAFRAELGSADCVAAVSAGGVCFWSSREAKSLQDLEQGLTSALTNHWAGDSCDDGEDVAMPDG